MRARSRLPRCSRTSCRVTTRRYAGACLDEIVAELGEILEAHIDDEEKTLFPALTADEPDRPRLAALLSAMRDDHAAVGELLGRMRTVTLFRELAELEGDVLRHVHLENHVGLPRFVRPAPRWRA